jgi:hypothetical protein
MKIQHTVRAPKSTPRGHRTYLNDTMITHRHNPELLRSIERARDWTGLNIRVEAP